MSRNINIIVAVTNDNAIGRQGDLVYHLRGDLKRFKELTIGHTVVMGRKTWQSLPNGALPGRRNIVISRDASFKADGADVYNSLEEAFAAVAEDSEIFIIGGEQVYRQSLPYARRVYLTRIDSDAAGADTFFPEIDMEQWEEESSSPFLTDEREGVRYRFICLSRK